MWKHMENMMEISIRAPKPRGYFPVSIHFHIFPFCHSPDFPSHDTCCFPLFQLHAIPTVGNDGRNRVR